MSKKTSEIKRYILFKTISIRQLLEYRFKKYKKISVLVPFNIFKGIEVTIEE